MEAPALSAAEVAALRPLMGLGWLDTYQVIRVTGYTKDERGARVPTTAVVETGRCKLDTVGNQPDEAAFAGRVQVMEPAVVLMPFETTATAADSLTVNGQPYKVHGVHRGGNLALYVTAVVSRGEA